MRRGLFLSMTNLPALGKAYLVGLLLGSSRIDLLFFLGTRCATNSNPTFRSIEESGLPKGFDLRFWSPKKTVVVRLPFYFELLSNPLKLC